MSSITHAVTHEICRLIAEGLCEHAQCANLLRLVLALLSFLTAHISTGNKVDGIQLLLIFTILYNMDNTIPRKFTMSLDPLVTATPPPTPQHCPIPSVMTVGAVPDKSLSAMALRWGSIQKR
jgi:hypothetical protein